MKLYEATAALETVNAWIEEHADEVLANGGALPPALADLLDLAEGDFAAKVEAVGLKVRELHAEAEAVKGEVARLAQRAKTATHAAESLKTYLHRALDAAGETTVKGTLVTVAIQQNPPSVQGDLSPDALSDLMADGADFVTLIPATFTLNKKRIIEMHKAGTAIPAGLVVAQGTSLRIR